MSSKIFAIDGREDFVKGIIEAYHGSIRYEAQKDEISFGEVQIDEFADHEIEVNFKETVRGFKVYLVCSTNTTKNMIKLFLAADAAKKASAEEIIAIIPYYGYARQDQKSMRGSSGASLFARLMQESGIDRVASIDLHAEQIQGFFKIPLDHIRGKYIFTSFIVGLQSIMGDITLCSPDAGGVKRVDAILKMVQKDFPENINMVMLSKRRDKPNSIESMDLIGDVKDRNVIIIDDIVDTAGTLCKAAEHIMEAGAKSVRAICTHGVLSGPAYTRIENSELEEVFVSDSLEIEVDGTRSHKDDKIKSISTAKPIARLIRAINNKQSANVLEEQHG